MMGIKWGDGVAKIIPADSFHGHIATVRMRPTKTNNVEEYQRVARLFASAEDNERTLRELAAWVKRCVPQIEPSCATS